MRYIQVLEEKLGRKARAQPPAHAARRRLAHRGRRHRHPKAALDYAPSTPIEVGVSNFVDWYLDYYRVGAN